MGFKISAISSWLDKSKPSELDLIDVGKEFGAYPKIEKPFFKDLINNTQLFDKYSIEGGLLGVKDPQGTAYQPDNWIFLWAVDFKDRFFQFLIHRSPTDDGKGVIAAAAPGELVQFMGSSQNSLVATLSLINDPKLIKGTMLLVTRPPSYKEKLETKQKTQMISQLTNWVNTMKAIPNKEGQWFPSFKPQCPVCNEFLTELEGYTVAFAQMVCPRCGFQMKKGK